MIKRLSRWLGKLYLSSSSKEDQQEYFVGIDLGTTKTAVCYGSFVDPRNTFFLQFGKNWKLPSIVAVEVPPAGVSTQKKALVSKVGENLEYDYMLRDSKLLTDLGLFRRVKLSLGRNSLRHSRPTELINGFLTRDHPIDLINKFPDLRPEYIIARVLEEVRRVFKENKPNHPNIYKATITVPASWDPEQRRATKMAAKMAGFTEVFLLEEPVAALLKCVDLAEFKDKKGVVIVVDFGGGTCDVAGVEISGRELTLIGATARNRLGGEILDDILFDDFMTKTREIAEKEKWHRHPDKKNIIRTIETDYRVRGYIRKQIEGFKIKLNENYIRFLEHGEEIKTTKKDENSIGIEIDKAIEQAQPEQQVKNGYWSEINLGGSVGFQLRFEVLFKEFEYLLSLKREDLKETDNHPSESIVSSFESLIEWFKQKYLIDEDGRKKLVHRVYSVGGSSNLFFVPRLIKEILKDYFDPTVPDELKVYEDSEREKAVAEGAADFEYQRSVGELKFRSKLFYNLELGKTSPVCILEEGQIIEPEGFERKPKDYELNNQSILPIEEDVSFSYSRESKINKAISGEDIPKRIRHNYPMKPNAPIKLGFKVSADGIIKITASDPLGIDTFVIPEDYPVEMDENLQFAINNYKDIF